MGLNLGGSSTAGEAGAEAEEVLAGLRNSFWRKSPQLEKEEEYLEEWCFIQYTKCVVFSTGKANTCGWPRDKEHFSCVNPSGGG